MRGAIERLLDAGSDVNVRDEYGRPLFSFYGARVFDSPELMRAFIDHGLDVGMRDGQTLLHEAAERGNPDMVALFLAQGLDVNVTSGSKETPLHRAAKGGHRDVVGLLIAKGADVSAKDFEGNTPLHLTSSKDIATLLVAGGADVNARNNEGKTPLQHAVAYEWTEVVAFLREHGAKEQEAGGRALRPER